MFAGRTYYGLESAQTVHAVQGGRQASPVELPDAPQYEERIDVTCNALVAKASFDTYNAREWGGYRAIQHPDDEANTRSRAKCSSVSTATTDEIDGFRAAHPDTEVRDQPT